MYLQLFLVIEGFAVAGLLAAWLTKDTRWPFFIGFNVLLPVTVVIAFHGEAQNWRKWMVLGAVAFYLLRMNWVLLFWFKNTGASKLKSHMSSAQLLSLPLILTNAFGWLYTVPFFWTLNRSGDFDGWDGAAIAVYLVGTVFHFGSDYQKHRFKQNSDNHGQLIQTGFWRLSRHPNYFGDFLIYLSFGLSAGTLAGAVAPVVNLVQYFSDAIPKTESMAAQKYGAAWDDYARRTRCFAPYIY